MANAEITKNALADALKQLSAKKDIDKITVADIVEECGVNRQTFYYHFNDKYELLKYIYETELFNPLIDGISFENWEPKMVDALKYIRNMRSFFMNTIKSTYVFFEGYMKQTLLGVFYTAVDDLDKKNEISKESKMLYASFLTYGTCGVVVDWIMDGAKKNESELVEDLKNMFLKTEEIEITKILGKK